MREIGGKLMPESSDIAAQVVMCPNCGTRMRLSHTEPSTDKTKNVAVYGCVVCKFEIEQTFLSL